MELVLRYEPEGIWSVKESFLRTGKGERKDENEKGLTLTAKKTDVSQASWISSSVSLKWLILEKSF
jgi:hypothetical protein